MGKAKVMRPVVPGEMVSREKGAHSARARACREEFAGGEGLAGAANQLRERTQERTSVS